MTAAPPLWTPDSIALIDDNRMGGEGGALLFRNPRAAIEAREPGEITGALVGLDAALKNGLHAAGFFSYELGYALEPRLAPLLPKERAVPLLSFGLFDAPARLAPYEVERTLCRNAPESSYVISPPPEPQWSGEAYRARFAAVRALIAAGDVYQINLTFPLSFEFEGDPGALFAALRRSARAGHGAYLALRDLSVLSLSPELFIRRQGARLVARPMKGTAPRATALAADTAIRSALAGDAKNRAENLMIVDLLRNDLGRIAQTGTVAVNSLFEVETYPTLHQMVSEIGADSTASLADCLKALFPCGSVTGAPKIRAMEIIRDLEETPRGIYCGAVGHIEPNGDFAFNVAIRTVTIDAQGRGTLGVGSGLVFDSEPLAEYAECLLKAAFLTRDHSPFALIETFRWSAAEGYVLLDEHLSRLAESAAYFGFRHDAAGIRQQLEAAAGGFSEARRVRLTLSETGAIAIAGGPLPPPPQAPLKAVLSARPVRSGDPFLRHKTTRRAFFKEELTRLNGACGADEVLFVNERGEMTEGSRTNIFLERDGILLTPAGDCGLLPGALRARLIRDGRAREAVLAPGDLAAPLYLGNAVRGLMPARFAGPE